MPNKNHSKTLKTDKKKNKNKKKGHKPASNTLTRLLHDTWPNYQQAYMIRVNPKKKCSTSIHQDDDPAIYSCIKCLLRSQSINSKNTKKRLATH